MLGFLIRDVLIPAEIKGYYTLPYTIASVSITKFELTVTVILLQGKTTSVISSTTRIIETDATVSYEDRVTELLKELLVSGDSYDELRVALPSGSAVYKELTLPFSEDEKIRAIVAYEIEQYIPFSLSEVVIDYIKTGKLSNGQTTLLVAAVKREFIERFLEPFKKAERVPTHLTIDLFDLYKLYSVHPAYQRTNTTSVLLLLEPSVTSLAVIHDQRLVLIRTLADGIAGWIRQAAHETGLTTTQVQQKLLRFGLSDANDQNYSQTIQKTGEAFCNEVMFTLQSLHERIGPRDNQTESIVLTGRGSILPGMKEFIESCTHLSTTTFLIEPLFTQKVLQKEKNVAFDEQQLLSVATGYAARTGTQYNFAQGGLGAQKSTYIYWQVGMLIFLTLCGLGTLWGGMWWHLNRLNRVAALYEKESINFLKDQKLLEGKPARTINIAFDEAEKTLRGQEQVWLEFSTQTRFSFLYYLNELTKVINKKEIDLTLQKLTLNNRDMSLEGSVRDYDALSALQRQLGASQLFSYVPSLQTTKFATGPLPLRIPKGE